MGEVPVKVIRFQLFLLILALEILFLLINRNPRLRNLQSLTIATIPPYFDDTTFFLQDAISIKDMVDTFFFNPD